MYIRPPDAIQANVDDPYVEYREFLYLATYNITNCTIINNFGAGNSSNGGGACILLCAVVC